MQLKPLIAAFAVLMTLTTGGCVVHFPLADNGPSLQSAEESPSAADEQRSSTEPNNNNPIKGNSVDAPQ